MEVLENAPVNTDSNEQRVLPRFTMTKADWQSMVAKYDKEAHSSILFAERVCDFRFPGYHTQARNTIPLLIKDARTRFIKNPIDKRDRDGLLPRAPRGDYPTRTRPQRGHRGSSHL